MLISNPTYKPPKILFNKHLETIYPALFRKVSGVAFVRERIDTPDNDFLDLDWCASGSKELVIISHGLEGNASKPYMLGMTKAITTQLQKDVLAWNYRGCSGEMNRTNRFYHSGATDDLDLVVQHAISKGYERIHLVGFSLGGNLTLKFLGETGRKIQSAVAISVPLDLEQSSRKMMRWFNYVYTKRFLISLKKKAKEKMPVLDKPITRKEIDQLAHVFHFDDVITAPLHGFKDARHYYKECSSLYFLDRISTPTLILNAKNDPFLSDTCFPSEQLKNNPTVFLEAPTRGGHVGFADFKSSMYWSEKRATEFLSKHP